MKKNFEKMNKPARNVESIKKSLRHNLNKQAKRQRQDERKQAANTSLLTCDFENSFIAAEY